MMKKTFLLKKTVSLLVVLMTMLIPMMPPVTSALAQSGAVSRETPQGGPVRPTPAEQECEDDEPDFRAMLEEWKEVSEKNPNAFTVAFANAREAYHDYVSCVFGYAEKQMLKSAAFPWNGNEACLKTEDLTQSVITTEPNSLLPPLLEAYDSYKKHLLILSNNFRENGVVAAGDQTSLYTRLRVSNGFKNAAEFEAENALLAMDMAFTALKEMRLAFVIHVHLQCLLTNLDKYRRILGDIRGVIDVLPRALQDASVSK